MDSCEEDVKPPVPQLTGQTVLTEELQVQVKTEPDIPQEEDGEVSSDEEVGRSPKSDQSNKDGSGGRPATGLSTTATSFNDDASSPSSVSPRGSHDHPSPAQASPTPGAAGDISVAVTGTPSGSEAAISPASLPPTSAVQVDVVVKQEEQEEQHEPESIRVAKKSRPHHQEQGRESRGSNNSSSLSPGGSEHRSEEAEEDSEERRERRKLKKQKQREKRRQDEEDERVARREKKGRSRDELSPEAEPVIGQLNPIPERPADPPMKREPVEDERGPRNEGPRKRAPLSQYLTPVLRPNTGTVGQRIPLKVNHFEMMVEPKIESLYQYDVEIVPVEKLLPDGRKRRRRLLRKTEQYERNWTIFKAVCKNYPQYFQRRAIAYDRQKFLITVDPLGIEEDEQKSFKAKQVKNPDGSIDDYKFLVKEVGVINLAELDIVIDRNIEQRSLLPIQAIDIIMRQSHYHSNTFVPSGRAFFAPEGVMDLGCGRYLRKGFFMSARPVQNRSKPSSRSSSGTKKLKFALSLNVDTANSVFYKPINLADYVQETMRQGFNRQGLHAGQIREIERDIKVLRVKTIEGVASRRFKPRGLSRNTAETEVFQYQTRDGNVRDVCVAEYFEEKYQIRLRYPNVNLVVGGSKQKPVFYPMEVLEVLPDQKVSNTNLKEDQISQIIRQAALPPEQRMGEIEDLFHRANIAQDEIAKDFGIQVNSRMTQVEGRILPTPNVMYKGERVVKPAMGKWELNRNQFFKTGQPLKSWYIMMIGDRMPIQDRDIDQFIRAFRDAGDCTGMRIENPIDLKKVFRMDQVDAAFHEVVQEAGPGLQLILCIVPGKSPIYGEIKQLGDVTHGVMTQVLTSKVFKNCTQSRNPQATLFNILYKVNTKHEGINSILDTNDAVVRKFVNGPVLFLGADVTHPSPGSNMPSVASLVGNVDLSGCRYAAACTVQEAHKEMISDLESMTKNALRRYYKGTKRKPDQIFFYRDGMSEGQFATVLDHELTAVRKACEDLEPGYNPGITFVTVQKGHHNRLFLANPAHPRAKPSEKNAPAGTVVDTTITHPTEFDFFLLSHQGIQGTSRPTHYHVLHDDNGMTADEMQQLTFYLCHVYSRCTRSVSLPAPCYYAHLAAFRAREMLKRHGDVSDTRSIVSGGSGPPEINYDELKTVVAVNKSMRQRMYFV